MEAVSAENYGGSHIYYGVREHVAAAMNGMALHGGLSRTAQLFLVFTDYCRPSIRLSALMKQRVIYVMTHDSISLGEDGPTHQPVEHLSSLRAMPNVNVFPPCDAIETAEVGNCPAVERNALRHGVDATRLGADDDPFAENLSAKGGYIAADADGERKATIIATGPRSKSHWPRAGRFRRTGSVAVVSVTVSGTLRRAGRGVSPIGARA